MYIYVYIYICLYIYCYIVYIYFLVPNSITQKFFKKEVLKNLAKFIGKHLCWNLFFNKVAGLRPATLSKKKVFSCEFYLIFKNILFHRRHLVPANFDHTSLKHSRKIRPAEC